MSYSNTKVISIGAIGSNGGRSGIYSHQTNLTYPNNLGTVLAGIGNITLSGNVKKYEVIETTEDLITLSCAWYRLRKDYKNKTAITRIENMLSEQLFSSVTEEDRVHAAEIRDYYSKKFMVLSLKDQRLTSFRQDLYDYLNGDGKKFMEKVIPMIYRLPEFYEHDSKFDVVKRDFKKEIPNFKSYYGNNKLDLSLMPVAKFNKTLKRGKFIEYWLKDDNDFAYRFTLKPENTLTNLWDQMFDNGKINLKFAIQPSRLDDLEFFALLKVM